MNPLVIEIIGIVSTVFILVSMLFKTTTLKGSIFMRALNMTGSIIFVVYGCLLPAISTAVLNGALAIVNFVYLILLIKQARGSSNKALEETEKEKKEKED